MSTAGTTDLTPIDVVAVNVAPIDVQQILRQTADNLKLPAYAEPRWTVARHEARRAEVLAQIATLST